MNNQFTHPKERIRFAILTFFFAQGLCMASWASRIPDFKDVFAANYAFYWGLILFMIPVGKFVAIPLAGYLVSKLGSRSMVQVSILGYASSLLCVGLAHEVYLLGFLLFCFGVFWNLCDISFNTQGIEVERLYGKTIMATFHGGWSLGACAGALIGFVMILAGVSPIWHYTLIFIIILIIALSGRKYLQESAPQEAEVSDTKTKERNTAKAPNGFRLLFQKPEMLLLQLGLVGLFALIVESAMFDWSAVYFESVVHVPKSLQIGFLVFMIMMATGRFLTIIDKETNEACNEVIDIPAHPISFEHNSELSALSWEAVDNHLSLEELKDKYKKIISAPRIHPLFVLLLVGFANASFCKLFGGDLISMGIVFSATITGFYLKQQMQAKKINHYVVFIVSAFVASLCASTALIFDTTSEIAMATSVLYLVPGVPLINGVIDVVEGYVLTGFARLTEASLLIVSIAIGLSFTLLMVKNSLI
jgi:uncharacterized membrane protein YjjP (DUF1212 family)